MRRIFFFLTIIIISIFLWSGRGYPGSLFSGAKNVVQTPASDFSIRLKEFYQSLSHGNIQAAAEQLAYLKNTYGADPAFIAKIRIAEDKLEDKRTVLEQRELKQTIAQVKRYLASGELAKADEAFGRAQEKFPQDPAVEGLAKEIELKKYLSLQRIRTGLDTVMKLIDEDKEEEARRKTEEIKAHSPYIPDFYQQEIDTVLKSIEGQRAKKAAQAKVPSPAPRVSKAVPPASPETGREETDTKTAVEENRQKKAIDAALQRSAGEKKKKEIEEAERLMTKGNLKEADVLAAALTLRYPDERKIKTLRSRLNRQLERARKKREQETQKFFVQQAEQRKKAAIESIQESLRRNDVKEAGALIIPLRRLYPADRRFKILEAQLEKKKKQKVKEQKEEVDALLKARETQKTTELPAVVPVPDKPVPQLSAPERKEKQGYVKKVYQEAVRAYRHRSFDDAIKLFETVIKLEKNSVQQYTPSALKLMEKARQKKITNHQ